MKKILLTAFFILYYSSMAGALTITQITIGTTHPSNPATELAFLESFVGPISVISFEKNENLSGDSGTYTFQNAIKYFGVKSGKGDLSFALYVLDTPATQIDWTTAGLINGGGQNPTISHLIGWTVEGGPTQTPEPATMLLLGFGLVGLAGISRKKLRK